MNKLRFHARNAEAGLSDVAIIALIVASALIVLLLVGYFR